MKCVFFGSPLFASASLEALLKSKHSVVGVITQPDRPSGRGLKLEPPPVKKLALSHGIPIWQPEKVNTSATYDWLKNLQPDILVVVAYGEFLGEKLLTFCSHPPINVHPSLLPDLRGAAPMQWAVLKGYKETGVSTQFMAKQMDAGDILLQTKETIGENETSGELQERLRWVGASLLIATLDTLADDKLIPTAQDHAKATHAPLLKKEMGQISWKNTPADTLHNLIRGLSPWPGAFSFLAGKRVKLLQSRRVVSGTLPLGRSAPGTIRCHGDQLFVACSDAWLEILQLQGEGKRAALPRDFVNGMKGQSENTELCFTDSEGNI